MFNLKNWRVIGEYVYDDEGGRHQAFVAPIRSTDVLGSTIMPHERIQIEQSLKYSQAETGKLWAAAGLTEMGRWTRDDEYGKSDIQRDQVSTRRNNFSKWDWVWTRITPRFFTSCADRWAEGCILVFPNAGRCVRSV